MDPKPGWKTSEFYITVGTVLGSLLVAFLGVEQQQAAAQHAEQIGGWATTVATIAAGLAAGAYAFARTFAKKQD